MFIYLFIRLYLCLCIFKFIFIYLHIFIFTYLYMRIFMIFLHQCAFISSLHHSFYESGFFYVLQRRTSCIMFLWRNCPPVLAEWLLLSSVIFFIAYDVKILLMYGHLNATKKLVPYWFACFKKKSFFSIYLWNEKC